jgi:hypothetical protein
MNTLIITPVMQDIYQLQIKFITGGHHWIGLTSKVNDFYWVHDQKKPVFVNFASGYPVKSSKYFAYKYIGPRNITQ